VREVARLFETRAAALEAQQAELAQLQGESDADAGEREQLLAAFHSCQARGPPGRGGLGPRLGRAARRCARGP
jgi:hypothetical protein